MLSFLTWVYRTLIARSMLRLVSDTKRNARSCPLLQAVEDVGEHGSVRLGALWCAVRSPARRSPAAQLEPHRGVVAVAGYRRAEREVAEVLQQVVQFVEADVAGLAQK